MKTNILLIILFISSLFANNKRINDFKITGKRVGYIEIGTQLEIAKKKLLEEGYEYNFDNEFEAHMFIKNNQLKFIISTYPPHEKNIIRGIWIYDSNYFTNYDIQVGTDFVTIKNLNKKLDIGIRDEDGFPCISLDNKEFEIDNRLSLLITLNDKKKSYNFYDSVYYHTEKVILTKEEKVIEILLNDPIGDYEEFLNHSNTNEVNK